MFYVIGGANIDLRCKSTNDLIMKDSNPGNISFAMGGVARNFAVNLNHLKEDVSFITVFGDDSFADEIIKDMNSRDIDLSFSLRSDKYPTSMFVAIMDKEDMVVGVNDLSILNEINEEQIDILSKVVNDEDYLFLDTNFTETFIKYILDNVKGIKVCDGVSASKVYKLKELTGKIDYLKLNLLEAEKLSGTKLFNDETISAFLNELIKKGTKEILISGKTFVYVGNCDGVYKYSHNAYNPSPVNTIGAGDALISYYVCCRKNNLSIDEAVSRAICAAVLTTTVDEATIPYSLERIEEELKNIQIVKEKC